jgi:hypothetical protein
LAEIIVEPSRDIATLDIYHLDYRRPLYKEGFPFVIFWSEKAACTVVAKWFFLQIGLLDQALQFNGWIHDFSGQVFQANKTDYLNTVLNALKTGLPAVKFVRNPYARAFSGFLEVSRPHALTDASNWSSRSRRQILSELCSPSTSVEHAFSFRQYLLWRATKKAEEIDAHLAEQYVPRDDCLPMRIVQMEDGLSAFARLERQYNLPATSADHPVIFDSFHHHKKSSELSADEAAKILDLGIPLQRSEAFEFPTFDQDIALRSGLDDLMRRSFRNDIEKYGYDAVAPEESETAPRPPVKAANSHGVLSAIEIDALLVTNKQLLSRCNQLEAERDALLDRAESQKRLLDRERVRPGPLTESLLESRIFIVKGFLERREANRLRKLNFDEDYYLAHNPDVGARALDPLLHFVRHGRREGRQFRLND